LLSYHDASLSTKLNFAFVSIVVCIMFGQNMQHVL
jgi:hypothetical protein